MSGSDPKHMGDFAEGAHTLPHSAAEHVPGHFSEGQESGHGEHVRMGKSSDTYCPKCLATTGGVSAGG